MSGNIDLCNHYKKIQEQPTKNPNIGNEVCCPSEQSIQEIERTNAIKKKNQPDLFVKIVTRNRPGIANRLCPNNM